MTKLAGLVCVLMLSIASTSVATVEEPICCYCATDQVGGQVPFCALITTPEQEAALDLQCDAAGGFGLKCLAMMIGGTQSTCNAALEAEGVNCPVRSGAPAAGTVGLGMLAAGIAAVGIATLRRRRASSAA